MMGRMLARAAVIPPPSFRSHNFELKTSLSYTTLDVCLRSNESLGNFLNDHSNRMALGPYLKKPYTWFELFDLNRQTDSFI
jgi:hypothetical protein